MERRARTFGPVVERLRALDLFPLWVALLLALKVLVARHLVLGRALGWGFAGDLVILAAACSVTAFPRGRTARILLVLLSLATSLLLLAVVLYESFFEQLPTAQLLLMARQVRIGDDVFGLMTLRSALFFADIPFLAWFALRRSAGAHLRERHLRIVIAATVPFAIALTLATALVGTGTGALSVSYRFGLLPFQAASIFGGSLDTKADAVSLEQDLQRQIDEVTGHFDGGRLPGSPNRGQYAGKSVILIQMEALQAGLVGGRIEGQPIVPHLEALIARSHYFPNTYSQIGRGNTSDAEFIVNTSLLPPMDQPASVAYANKEIPSLPRLLGKRGYTTVTFHTNTADFWNRFQLYPAIGFGAFRDRAFFGDEDITGYGPSDRILYETVLAPLAAEVGEGRPFYAHLVTLSAHYPFKAAAGRSRLVLPPEISTTSTGRYLRAQAYADQQLGWFVNKLEESGILNDTILVVYGDHFGLRWEDETDQDKAIRKLLYGHAYNRADFYNIPLIVHLPGQTEPLVSDVVLGQVDVMPTLADLLGVDLEDVPHFGRSAFVDTPTQLTRPGAMPMSIDDGLLYIQGIDGKEDRFYLSKSQEKLPIKQPPPEAFDDTEMQLILSGQYASGLPERSGARPEETGFIPTPGVDFR